jgi:diphthine-ammonia ligase
MKLAAMISGGKDSIYAAWLASQDHELAYAISMVPKSHESYMFHFPNIHFVRDQARLMGVELLQRETEGEKELELDDLESAIVSIKNEVDGIVTGALASSYQKMRIDSICKRHGLLSIAPLWQIDPATYLRKAIDEGFEIIIAGVAAPPLDEKWLGRRIDEKCIQDLEFMNKRHGIHIGGEGGEFESFVLDCPLFAKRIRVLQAERVWDAKSRSGYYDIKNIDFEDK